MRGPSRRRSIGRELIFFVTFLYQDKKVIDDFFSALKYSAKSWSWSGKWIVKLNKKLQVSFSIINGQKKYPLLSMTWYRCPGVKKLETRRWLFKAAFLQLFDWILDLSLSLSWNKESNQRKIQGKRHRSAGFAIPRPLFHWILVLLFFAFDEAVKCSRLCWSSLHGADYTMPLELRRWLQNKIINWKVLFYRQLYEFTIQQQVDSFSV